MTTYLQPAACGTMNHGTGFAPLSGSQGLLQALVARAVGQFTLLGAWYERARQRRHLSELDGRLLDDIGVSRAAAAHEAAKQPWEA